MFIAGAVHEDFLPLPAARRNNKSNIEKSIRLGLLSDSWTVLYRNASKRDPRGSVRPSDFFNGLEVDGTKAVTPSPVMQRDEFEDAVID